MQGVLKGVFVKQDVPDPLAQLCSEEGANVTNKKTPNRSHFGQTAGEPATTLSQWKPRRGFEMV